MRRWLEPLRASVRAKLLALVLAPLMLGFPIIMGLLGWWGEAYYQRLMSSRVSSDLATAHGYLERVVEGAGSGVRGLAGSHALALAREQAAPTPGEDGDPLVALLAARQAQLGLDFLNLLDVEGRVLRSSVGTAPGSARSGWPVVDRAIRAAGGSAIERFGPAELEAVRRGGMEALPDAKAKYNVEMSDVASALGTPAVDRNGNPRMDPFTGKQIINRDPKKEAEFFQWMRDNNITDTNKGLALYLGQKRESGPKKLENVTDADIKATAKKYGITEDDVRRRLGLN